MKSALIRLIECRADEQAIKTWPCRIAASVRYVPGLIPIDLPTNRQKI